MMEQNWQPRSFNEIETGRLAAVALRPTAMRLILLDLFEQHGDRPLSCEEAYKLLTRAGLDVKLSSIYSNVRTMVGCGVLVAGVPRKRVRTSATFLLSR